MKACIYYIMSQEVVDRWNRTMLLQERLLPEWSDIPKVFVADRNLSIRVPGDIVTTELFDNTLMRFSMAKNLGLKWAEDHSYEWVIDCDADTVILKLPTKEPSTGYGAVLCYQARKEDSDEDLVGLYMSGGMVFGPASRFVLRRDIFTKYHFDEGYVDWIWDDIDYHANVLEANGIMFENCGSVGIHIWHPRKRSRQGNGKERYEMKRSRIINEGKVQ